MFSSRQSEATVIAKGLKISGIVTAEGSVELNGSVEERSTVIPSSYHAMRESSALSKPSVSRWMALLKGQSRVVK